MVCEKRIHYSKEFGPSHAMTNRCITFCFHVDLCQDLCFMYAERPFTDELTKLVDLNVEYNFGLRYVQHIPGSVLARFPPTPRLAQNKTSLRLKHFLRL